MSLRDRKKDDLLDYDVIVRTETVTYEVTRVRVRVGELYDHTSRQPATRAIAQIANGQGRPAQSEDFTRMGLPVKKNSTTRTATDWTEVA